MHWGAIVGFLQDAEEPGDAEPAGAKVHGVGRYQAVLWNSSSHVIIKDIAHHGRPAQGGGGQVGSTEGVAMVPGGDAKPHVLELWNILGAAGEGQQPVCRLLVPHEALGIEQVGAALLVGAPTTATATATGGHPDMRTVGERGAGFDAGTVVVLLLDARRRESAPMPVPLFEPRSSGRHV